MIKKTLVTEGFKEEYLQSMLSSLRIIVFGRQRCRIRCPVWLVNVIFTKETGIFTLLAAEL